MPSSLSYISRADYQVPRSAVFTAASVLVSYYYKGSRVMSMSLSLSELVDLEEPIELLSLNPL